MMVENSSISPADDQPILEVRELAKHFEIGSGLSFKRKTGVVKAVDGVSFSLRPGETLGLVGGKRMR